MVCRTELVSLCMLPSVVRHSALWLLCCLVWTRALCCPNLLQRAPRRRRDARRGRGDAAGRPIPGCRTAGGSSVRCRRGSPATALRGGDCVWHQGRLQPQHPWDAAPGTAEPSTGPGCHHLAQSAPSAVKGFPTFSLLVPVPTGEDKHPCHLPHCPLNHLVLVVPQHQRCPCPAAPGTRPLSLRKARRRVCVARPQPGERMGWRGESGE